MELLTRSASTCPSTRSGRGRTRLVLRSTFLSKAHAHGYPNSCESARVSNWENGFAVVFERIRAGAPYIWTKAASGIVSFSGVRLEVLGDYLGNDGLKVKDFPEMTIKGVTVSFDEIPTLVNVRKPLSKNGKQFFTFLCDEGYDYLKQCLEWRLRRKEKLTAESPIMTPSHEHLAGAYIRTTNISDFIRKVMRNAGFKWRPYVLRRYFDTRLMMAESDGLISETIVPSGWDTTETKAASKCLVTSRKDSTNQDTMIERFNRQFLTIVGYSEKEISQFGALSGPSDQNVQDFIQKKPMRALGLNGNGRQKIVPLADVRNWITDGWEYVSRLSTEEAIIKLPGS